MGMGKKDILRAAKEANVQFIRFWFTDVLGFLKSFAITIDELEGALEDGMGFDGSSIEGFARIEESDVVAMPNPDTWTLLPWRDDEEKGTVARMFCDVLRPDGEHYEGDPRWALKRILKRAADKGYTFYVGPELEYFYFRNSGNTGILDKGGYFDLTPLDVASNLRRDTVLALHEMGIPCEYSHHEVAPSQHEIDLRYRDALTMADSAMTYRLTVKEVAMKHGVYLRHLPAQCGVPRVSVDGGGFQPCVANDLLAGERVYSGFLHCGRHLVAPELGTGKVRPAYLFSYLYKLPAQLLGRDPAHIFPKLLGKLLLFFACPLFAGAR